jgi:uncharacterized membrane protein YhaH (DUF805 family)
MDTSSPAVVPAKNSTFFPIELFRLQYLVRWFIWFVTAGVGAALLAPIPALGPIAMIVWVLSALVYRIVALDIPRLRNAGMSPWLLLLFLVPVANLAILILLFVAPPKK